MTMTVVILGMAIIFILIVCRISFLDQVQRTIPNQLLSYSQCVCSGHRQILFLTSRKCQSDGFTIFQRYVFIIRQRNTVVHTIFHIDNLQCFRRIRFQVEGHCLTIHAGFILKCQIYHWFPYGVNRSFIISVHRNHTVCRVISNIITLNRVIVKSQQEISRRMLKEIPTRHFVVSKFRCIFI